jgi:hypothetical protein
MAERNGFSSGYVNSEDVGSKFLRNSWQSTLYQPGKAECKIYSNIVYVVGGVLNGRMRCMSNGRSGHPGLAEI